MCLCGQIPDNTVNSVAYRLCYSLTVSSLLSVMLLMKSAVNINITVHTHPKTEWRYSRSTFSSKKFKSSPPFSKWFQIWCVFTRVSGSNPDSLSPHSTLTERPPLADIASWMINIIMSKKLLHSHHFHVYCTVVWAALCFYYASHDECGARGKCECTV